MRCTHRFYPKIWKTPVAFLLVTVSLSPRLTVSGLHPTHDVSGLGEHFHLWTPPIVQVGSLRHRSPLHRPLGHYKKPEKIRCAAQKHALRARSAQRAPRGALRVARSAWRAPRADPKIGNLEKSVYTWTGYRQPEP